MSLDNKLFLALLSGKSIISEFAKLLTLTGLGANLGDYQCVELGTKIIRNDFQMRSFCVKIVFWIILFKHCSLQFPWIRSRSDNVRICVCGNHAPMQVQFQAGLSLIIPDFLSGVNVCQLGIRVLFHVNLKTFWIWIGS